MITSVVIVLGLWGATLIWAVRLRERLRIDPLTGLANRTGLRAVFNRTSVRSGQRAALLMLDLNDFKSVNDTYGHRVGDLVLTEVGRRLRSHVGARHLAIRLSGDEFALWLGAFPDTAEHRHFVETIAERINVAIAEPMHIDGRLLAVTASIGLALMSTKPSSLEQLLEPADRAMYGDKKRPGRESVQANRLPFPKWEVVA